jgi:NAD(P)-dependent dehydrogenase (short-subunit alcohol dehydrogenase family)
MKSVIAAALVLNIFAALAAGGAQAATVLITGTNRGLGLEFVRQYAAEGWTIIATARNLDDAKELKALAAAHKNISLKKLDVANAESIAALVKDLKGTPIDLLLHNAAVLGDLPKQTLGNFDYDNFEQVMSVNVYSPLALSQALRDNVVASQQKKIVALTSGAGVISGSAAGGNIYFYRASKAALNYSMKGLALDLKDKGVIVGVVAPGPTDTDMRRALVGEAAVNDNTPQTAVAGMRKVIAGLNEPGKLVPMNYDGKQLPW